MVIIDTNIHVKVIESDIGSFTCAFEFRDTEQEIIEKMIEWLSNCCTENFIVSETRSRLIAGGYSDNKKAFEMGHFSLPNGQRAREGDLGTFYEVRLNKEDIFAFRLRWLDESDNEVD